MTTARKGSYPNEDWDAFRSLDGMVRMTLVTVWDPIGVFGHKYPLGEYDNYVLAILELLRNGATVEQLEAHLQNIHKEKMEIGMNAWTIRADRLTAETLFNVFKNYNF